MDWFGTWYKTSNNMKCCVGTERIVYDLIEEIKVIRMTNPDLDTFHITREKSLPHSVNRIYKICPNEWNQVSIFRVNNIQHKMLLGIYSYDTGRVTTDTEHLNEMAQLIPKIRPDCSNKAKLGKTWTIQSTYHI
jgi:hypothetical protein